jgi:hypothetical protein
VGLTNASDAAAAPVAAAAAAAGTMCMLLQRRGAWGTPATMRERSA